jgi:hypothetical protein
MHARPGAKSFQLGSFRTYHDYNTNLVVMVSVGPSMHGLSNHKPCRPYSTDGYDSRAGCHVLCGPDIT